MSDWWPFSSSPPPIIHHSSPSQSSPFTSPHLVPHTQVTSPHLVPHTQVTSPHLVPHTQVTSPHYVPHPQVTSPHLAPHTQVTSPHYVPHPQVTSPHLAPHTQVTSPHLAPHTQVTSPHYVPHPQVTSPHLVPHTQVTSPHLVPHTQVTSPHLVPHTQVTSSHLVPHPQVTSSHLAPHTQVTSSHYVPHPQVTSPHLAPHTQVTSSHLAPHTQVTSPHLVPQSQETSPHQHHLYNQGPGLDNPDWSRAQPPSELSYLLKSFGYQNQSTAHLDLQNQNQFSTGVTHHQDEWVNPHRLPYNTHTHLSSGIYGPGNPSGPVQGTWRPTPPQLQCLPLGPMTGGVALGRWSSMEFNSPSAEDFSGTQFFHDSYLDDYAPQPFCSPTTPGPSPHYPQTPTFSSPGPQMHPSTERLDFNIQQLSRDETLSCLPHPHQTSRHLQQSRSELIQDQTGVLDTTESCFSPHGGGQDVSSAAQSPGLSAGLSWREESGGRGGRGRGGSRGGRRRGGGDTQKMKRPQPETITQVLKSRLLCTVCKRDFRSLPALNGHMRSHSGSRSASCLNPVVQPSASMVMPVSVPVQSGGPAKPCHGGQRGRCRHPSPTTGGEAPLYRSLLHQEEEEDEDGGKAGDDGAHYTPPPVLCPIRAGPGLYCSLATRGQQRVQTVRLNNNNNKGLVVTASPPARTLINKPRINEGRRFQAEIPPLRVRKDADSHNALLLWTPWDELEHPVSQHRVEALLTMARSNVVPGGGASPEVALDVLSECRGDFLLAVEKLLSPPETSDNKHTAHRHPVVSWSTAERRLLVKSLQRHQKDFSRIQKTVQTKSLSQCVEFYYLWKRKLSLSARTPAGLTVSLPDTNILISLIKTTNLKSRLQVPSQDYKSQIKTTSPKSRRQVPNQDYKSQIKTTSPKSRLQVPSQDYKSQVKTTSPKSRRQVPSQDYKSQVQKSSRSHAAS
ncbi:zinc finger protein 541-like [Anarrhichthys ocellatus]|uniref:zinc finger protein 541-like n=1 Tax=Anarrhichthys ocellatus TaxID=433405 RepID=UPI0012EE8AF4|nr:zinc finger protein 541-like [Anarrhichthys ocellatus]